eukprot:6180618-Pleurochrysis_carterae.AAC.1
MEEVNRGESSLLVCMKKSNISSKSVLSRNSCSESSADGLEQDGSLAWSDMLAVQQDLHHSRLQPKGL